ncbi:FHA domain-containing protein [Vibrio chaetopteri]|uniref:FHA domain-containing protein n=1 Tax=Vibrio chaetopteri TaxID=3016528 RepID=UPI003AB591CE
MGFKLGPDGKPVEVNTTYGSNDEGATQPPKSGKIDLFGHIDNSVQSHVPAEEKTRIVGHQTSEEPATQIHMGSYASIQQEDVAPQAATVEELVCGWFVVVDGPGKGRSITVGPGQSIISRSASERITLNFGDNTITSKQQLIVIYDDRYNEFFVAPGNGSSLNRINGQILATTSQLKSGDQLEIGATTVRFVAFCDDNFTWSK